MAEDRLLLDEPRYTYAEADRVAGVSRGTSKRWLKGYQYYGADGRIVHQPPVSSARPVEPGVSFLELIEVAAIGRLKDHGFSLARLRELLAAARRVMGVERPLIELVFRTDGRALFVQHGRATPLVGLSRPRGQVAWDVVLEPFLRTVEYEGGVAFRWWPMGREQEVVIDPRFAFGQPVIDGTGVRTDILWEQFVAGSDEEQIAADFALDPKVVEKALRFEARHHDALASSG